jgi:hypothetical protein
MNDQVSRAEELISLTLRLAAIVEDDVRTLKAKRPAMLAASENERTTASLLYAKAATEFKSPASVTSLPAPVRTKLKAATARLRTATREQTTLLTAFRHVTEGLVKAVADVVARKSMPSAYAKSGNLAQPSAAFRPTALTLNQAV